MKNKIKPFMQLQIKNILFFSLTTILATPLVEAQGTQKAPIINKISESHSAPGTIISLIGLNFPDSTKHAKVTFRDAVAEVISTSENLIRVKVPGNATHGNITVYNGRNNLIGESSEIFFPSYSGSPFQMEKISPNNKKKFLLNIPPEKKIEDFCLCDFNNDGKEDIAVTHNNRTIDIFKNESNGAEHTSFSLFQQIDIVYSTDHIICKDINGDTKPELVISIPAQPTPGRYIRIIRNESVGGTIQLNPIPIIETISIPLARTKDGKTSQKIAVEDIDKDGKPDVIATIIPETFIVIFKNQSNIYTYSFLPPISIETDEEPLYSLEIKDMNNDLFPDIVFSTKNSNDVHIILNESSPGNIKFNTQNKITIPTSNVTNLIVGDIDNDNYNDIIFTENSVTSVSKNINILKNRRNLTFSTIKVPIPSNPWGLDLGDINGDKKLDIITSGYIGSNKSLSIIINNYTSNEIASTDFSVLELENIGQHTKNIKIGDVNRDGKPDIIATGLDSNSVITIPNYNCLKPKILHPKANGIDTITICKGSTVELNATPSIGHRYQWVITNTNNTRTLNPRDTSSTFIIPSNTAKTFLVKVIVSTNRCVDSSNNVIVNVKDATSVPAPTLTTSPENLRECDGEQLILVIKVQDPTQTNFTSTIKDYLWTTPATYDGLLPEENQQASTISQKVFVIQPFNINKAGTYYFSYINTDGCQSPVLEIKTSLISFPKISPNIGNSNACAGNTDTIRAPYYPGYKYEWYKDNEEEGQDIFVDSNGGNTLPVTENGVYYLKLSETSTASTRNCSYISPSRSIIFRNKPVLLPSNIHIQLKDEELLPDSTNTKICKDLPLIFSVSPESIDTSGIQTQKLTLSYKWYPEYEFLDTSIITPNLEYTYRDVQQKNIKVEVGYNEVKDCYSETQTTRIITEPVVNKIKFTQRIKDISDIENNAIIGIKCRETTEIIELDTALTIEEQLNGITKEYQNFIWIKDNDTTQIISYKKTLSVSDSGLYKILTTDVAQCQSITPIKIREYPKNTPQIILSKNIVNEYDTVVITIENINKTYPIQWKDSAQLKLFQIKTDPIHQIRYKASYQSYDFLNTDTLIKSITVNAFDALYGCQQEATKSIKIIPYKEPRPGHLTNNDPSPKYFHSSFSPNGDGFDDLWILDNVEFNQTCTLIIFDRRGKIVYQKQGYKNDWDGTLNGNGTPLDQGVYYYIFDCVQSDRTLNTENITGTVLIYR
ncbi:MAG: FG-GAP-like repeat-containing protein [Chitinophagaceae bacterium]|nr:FG-GAP-like repeat-containing protein [Chitinophagaceae bacterium]